MLLSLISIGLMTVDHRYRHLETMRAGLLTLVYPLQYVINLPVATGNWVADSLSTRSNLLNENATLKHQNLLLKSQLQKYEALEVENMRLRELLESSFKVGERVLIAELLAVDLDPFKRLIVINKGSTNDVFSGQPLLDADGVMGQINHVSPLSSTAMMITDPSHAIPIQVNRNGLRAIAIGTGSLNNLELPHIPHSADIKEGDLLVTSGLGGRFPPDYPVARVVKIEHNSGDPFLYIVAEPTAHLQRSREVLLVWPTETAPAPAATSKPAP